MIPNRSRELVAAARAEIVGGEEVERDDLHAGGFAPPEELWNLLGPGPVAERRALLQPLLRPAPVAVDDDRDVVRHLRLDDLTPQPPLVQTVQQAGARLGWLGTHLGSLAIGAVGLPGIRSAGLRQRWGSPTHMPPQICREHTLET